MNTLQQVKINNLLAMKEQAILCQASDETIETINVELQAIRRQAFDKVSAVPVYAYCDES